MKFITFSTIFLLPFASFAEGDIRSKVVEGGKAVVTTSEIDIGKHIFGHKYGISENDFIAKEGKPDGYLSLSNGKTVMIYGKDVGIVFKNNKLIGVRISNSIIDWELAKDLKSKSRLDGINWRVKQGVHNNMTKEQLVKKHGDNLRGGDYENFLQIGEDRLVIRFSSMRTDGGERKFTVCGIYLLREE